MSMNETPRADRIHIGIFGKRNSGKSSLINAVTGQGVAIVSDTPGTTTDPVYKAMELLPLGPVVFIDTPGLDDVGTLGELRIKKTQAVLTKCDIAIIVCNAQEKLAEVERQIQDRLLKRGIPCIIVFNKSDLPHKHGEGLFVSARTGDGIEQLKNELALITVSEERYMIRDRLKPNDTVVLVIPVDSSAPKGRIILPQQQVLREVLDAHAVAVATQPQQLSALLENLKKPPAFVITDSQAFVQVRNAVPKDIALTSFSILLARKKECFEFASESVKRLDCIKDGDKILISEGCTHHRQCEDIGTVKLPKLIRSYTGAEPRFEFTSGGEFPESLKDFSLVVHCGGCMLTDREVKFRYSLAETQGVPMTNYGIAIAYMTHITVKF